MATAPVTPPSRDPLARLHTHLFCMEPDVKNLSPEQRAALHEFFHTVLAAGYRLYQAVPAQQAAALILKKFGLVLEDPDATGD